MFCILIRVYKFVEIHYAEHRRHAFYSLNMKNKEFKLMEDELKQFYPLLWK